MQVTYSREVDALAIQITSATRPISRDIAPGVTGDFDRKGRLVAIEILSASKRYPDADFSRIEKPQVLITLEDAVVAAKRLGVHISSSTLRGQIHHRRLEARKLGREWVTTQEKLVAYLRSRARSGRRGKALAPK